MFSAYPEIRLGLLRFHANVQESDEKFWSYMNVEVLPRVRSAIEGKEWSEITGIKEVVLLTRRLAGIPAGTEFRLRH